MVTFEEYVNHYLPKPIAKRYIYNANNFPFESIRVFVVENRLSELKIQDNKYVGSFATGVFDAHKTPEGYKYWALVGRQYITQLKD